MNEEYENELDAAEMAEGDAFSNVAQGLSGNSKAQLVEYWQQVIDSIERIGENDDGDGEDTFKSTALPLARIKKVMKTDSEVRMISAEAPVLFAKGCDIFITELTMRAWIHAEESKRRTLQRSDIATALQKSDMFDFLIDIVPREEAQPRRYHPSQQAHPAAHQPGPSHGPPHGPVQVPGPHMPPPGHLPSHVPQHEHPPHHLGGLPQAPSHGVSHATHPMSKGDTDAAHTVPRPQPGDRDAVPPGSDVKLENSLAPTDVGYNEPDFEYAASFSESVDV